MRMDTKKPLELGEWVTGALCVSEERWNARGTRRPSLVAGAGPVTGYVITLYPGLPDVAEVRLENTNSAIVRYPKRTHAPIPEATEDE